ncbi:MAG: Spy/CpxP family protein refolding chaperone [Rhodospirillaceae bacterium]|nr:Spy/CpxP family protein refolding chaperone [Rhodospirillaceae bacterium]
MNTLRNATLIAAFAAILPFAGAGAQMHMGPGGAQNDACEPGMGMVCMMGDHPRMMMGGEWMGQRLDQRLEALKTRLKITDAQAKEWDAYAAALRDAAKAMTEQRQALRGKMMTATLPQRLDIHEAMLVSHLDQLRKTKAAANALYAVLSDEQKKIADTTMMGNMPRRRMRGPHR